MSFEDRSTTACGCAEAIELGAQADARIAELEAENAKLRALLTPLQGIAFCANQLDGGGCCDEHYKEMQRKQRELMKSFTDDSFTELKGGK